MPNGYPLGVNNSAHSVSSQPSPLRIGQVDLGGRALLAPLSGVTDVGMRRAAQAFGASLVVSEMVAAEAYVAADEETRLRADGVGIAIHVVQIAGRTPTALAEAARLAEATGAAIIDINMGCPAKRVVGGYAGSWLMREPVLATELVRTVVGAVRVPVTVKMRLGWDDASRNAPDLARRVTGEGAAMITVHGRTRAQFYKGKADWTAIRAVREAIDVPLVANGDCASPADARQMLQESGADAVMIGRAAMGRPWLVGNIAAALRGESVRLPTAAQRRDAATAHYQSLLSGMGRHSGVRHARKHLVAYARCAIEDGFEVGSDVPSRLAIGEEPEAILTLLAQLWTASAMREAA